jgi:hypothetical protein
VYVNNSYLYFTEGAGLFMFLTLLSALQIYTFIYVYILTTFLTEQPKLNSGVPTVG